MKILWTKFGWLWNVWDWHFATVSVRWCAPSKFFAKYYLQKTFCKEILFAKTISKDGAPRANSLQNTIRKKTFCKEILSANTISKDGAPLADFLQNTFCKNN